MRRVFELRPLDVFVLCVLAAVNVVNGVYLIGPWYITSTPNGAASPLISMFASDTAVIIFGSVILLDGLVLGWAAHRRKAPLLLLSTSLFVGFLLRLYSLLGVLITQGAFLPPSYISHLASMLILGGYWVSVKVNARPTE